jgi:hypothetical protein
MKISETTVVVAAPRQVSSDLGEEAVILELDQGVYYGLNTVGARIWSLVQEPRTVAGIRDTILAEFDVDPARCTEDVMRLLADLAEHRLIEVRDAPAP